MSVPNPEQTASIASFLTYIWIEPTIWKAYRTPHLPADELPPLCDYDEVKNLIVRGYPVIPPTVSTLWSWKLTEMTLSVLTCSLEVRRKVIYSLA